MKQKHRKFIFLFAILSSLTLICTVAIYWQTIVEWYEFQSEFETLPINAQGLREYKHSRTGIIFVKIPGGKFMMGSPENEKGRSILEEPQQEVTLPSFLIAKYEVSQEQWEKVMGSNPSHFKGKHLPVENVNWEEIQEYTKENGLTLPTEAQWEYACRAGTSTRFSFGAEISIEMANIRNRQLNKKSNQRTMMGKTVPVNQFKPNAFGLHQMHGNVYEWCEDLFPNQHFFVGKNFKDSRALRGGSFSSRPDDVRSSARISQLQNSKSLSVGFRPVWNLNHGTAEKE